MLNISQKRSICTPIWRLLVRGKGGKSRRPRLSHRASLILMSTRTQRSLDPTLCRVRCPRQSSLRRHPPARPHGPRRPHHRVPAQPLHVLQQLLALRSASTPTTDPIRAHRAHPLAIGRGRAALPVNPRRFHRTLIRHRVPTQHGFTRTLHSR